MATPPSAGVVGDAFRGRRSFSMSGCNPNGRGENGSEKTVTTCAVRHGYMGYIGEFRYAPGVLTACGSKVVVQTNRGIEIGEQISLTCSGCENSINRQQMLDYVKNCEASEFLQPRAGRVLRQATPQDLQEEARIREDAKEKLARARGLAASMELEMKLVACEHLFGGERIVFHFMSEARVDFRDLVRDLAHEYHTRIEMHQVGARDEARLIADYEMCGRECCCKNFLKKLRPVTMRMAKLQKATLDPSKVSGRCGRLRCCLRYEYEGYDELNKKLPRVGTRVRTERGVATVKDRQLLTQLIMLVYDDRDQEEAVGVEEILERNLPRSASAELRPAGRKEPGAGRVEEGQRKTEQRPVGRPVAAGAPSDRTYARAENEDAPPDEVMAASPGETSAGEPDKAAADSGGDQPRSGRRRGRRGRRRRKQLPGGGSGEGGSSPG